MLPQKDHKGGLEVFTRKGGTLTDVKSIPRGVLVNLLLLTYLKGVPTNYRTVFKSFYPSKILCAEICNIFQNFYRNNFIVNLLRHEQPSYFEKRIPN